MAEIEELKLRVNEFRMIIYEDDGLLGCICPAGKAVIHDNQ